MEDRERKKQDPTDNYGFKMKKQHFGGFQLYKCHRIDFCSGATINSLSQSVELVSTLEYVSLQIMVV